MLDFVPMPHTVSIEKAGELNAWGEYEDTGEAITHKARISYNSKRETISVASGEDIVFTATIAINGDVPISYQDYIVWQDSRGQQFKKQPIEIKDRHDLAGSIIGVRLVL